MIKKYNDFILESKIPSLILEGEFSGSINFIERLRKISKTSKVAGELHRLFGFELEVDKDLSQNYIDVTDKDDTVTFISDQRVSRLPLDSSPYMSSSRSEIKVGRFARAILTDPEIKKQIGFTATFTDKDFEDFVNLYKAGNTQVKNEFKLVNSSKISRYYYEDTYAYQKGDLGNSCMKYESCQDYFGIYEENSDVCSLLVYLDSAGYVLGRALVWSVSKSPCSAKKFMDRIYTASDSDRYKFIEWANENDCMYKYKNSSDETEGLFFKYKGEIFLGEVVVNLKKVNFDEYPYVDTLRYLNKKDKTLSNVGSKKVKILNDTGGGWDHCWHCDESGVDEGECQVCDGGGTVNCKKCGGTGTHEDKKCKKCDGEGWRDCKECDGSGSVKIPCPECAGSYRSSLESGSFPSELKDLVKSELERMKLENSYRPK
jgi:hypothetical protein